MTMADGLGSRVVLHEGLSSLSGSYVVEECDGDDDTRVRRLVFLNSPTVSQTEMRLVPAAKHSKKKKQRKNLSAPTKVDHSHVASAYLRCMIASLGLHSHFLSCGVTKSTAEQEQKMKILLIGLGGGALVMFISKYMPNLLPRTVQPGTYTQGITTTETKIKVDVVELDSEVISVAQKYFEFSTNERITVEICDGIEYVKNVHSAGKNETYDAVVLDVDSKDTKLGMACPPIEFLGQEFLIACQHVLKNTGMMMLNISARNKDMKTKALKSLQGTFPAVFTLGISEDVNEVVLAYSSSGETVKSTVFTSSREQFRTEKLTFAPCKLRPTAQDGVRKFVESIVGRAGGDIEPESFICDLLETFSSVNEYHAEADS